MTLSHRIQIDTTVRQREYFARAAGTARMVWNWGLAAWNEQSRSGQKPNGMSLRRQFNAIKYQQFSWLQFIHRDAHDRPFANLQRAFIGFVRGVRRRPTFKRKGRCRDSFYVANYKLRIDDRRIRLPVIGWVRLTEPLRFTGKIMGAVVSREADRWFISIQVDVGDYQKPRTGDGIIGVDLGVSAAATLSTGESIVGPKPLAASLKRMKRLQRHHSRKQPGSANRRKSAMRLARLHRRIANIRSDFWNKLTTRLCRENQAVGIEDLNVRGMVKNRCLARSVSDMGMGEFRRQMTYKAPIYGTRLVVADRWFPSSKRCASCGTIESDLSLSDRTYRCDGCGREVGRDLNAAENLEQLCTAGLAGTNACGPEGSGGRRTSAVAKPCRVEAGTGIARK